MEVHGVFGVNRIDSLGKEGLHGGEGLRTVVDEGLQNNVDVFRGAFVGDEAAVDVGMGDLGGGDGPAEKFLQSPTQKDSLGIDHEAFPHGLERRLMNVFGKVAMIIEGRK